MDSSSTLGLLIALAPFAAIFLLLYLHTLRLGTPSCPTNTKPAEEAMPWPRIIGRDEHSVSRREISDNALKVMYRLKDAGYEAYLVGGCVRDQLLDLHPKDFDIATDAHPEQVHELFRNSRLIGRRFKLVHVRFGREIIEVATFRASHDTAEDPDEKHGKQADSGMILRDNVYGTVEEDALRRDFTVNALYYNIRDFAIHDYANGWEDLHKRQLRLIGDPESRYREDPVRMLRAVRFAAKLEFNIETETEAPIRRLAPLISAVPAARLFEEILKLMLSGQGETTYQLLRHYNLFEQLFPLTAKALSKADHSSPEATQAEALLINALRNTDTRLRQGKTVTPAFFFAAVLWHPLRQRAAELEAEGLPPIPAQQQAAQDIIVQQSRHTAIPRRFSMPMREIWDLQLRLPRRHGHHAAQLHEHPRFRAAYDFLLLREASGEDLDGLGIWWTQYQESNSIDRERIISELPRPDKKPRRRRRRRSNKQASQRG